ncbi:hypothetical protein AAMO2058_000662200 [Amorphochlora amoebiformis]|uniref:Dual specificity phosphatase catalytic domain-containing protein n=1 Tax=Amorphochlora amoebiformis TaxID=1561963 RepID=A0A7S0GPB3_9EUKA|mmetsp:Transcript_1000/g.1407  ORF Transcript_1000/g.1407 Transcript_1000/m.1407 type:complete len:227 (+) Transcript_1000:49-729(+)
MGQCCTIRGGGINGRPSSDIGDKDWGTTDIGPYSSNGTGVPAIRVISTVIVDGRPCKNSLYLGNSLAGNDQKLLAFHGIKRRIQICTERDHKDLDLFARQNERAMKDPQILSVTLCAIKKTNLTETIEKSYKFIRQAAVKRENILIHSKSPKHQTEAWSIAVACGCLMKMCNWSLDQALYHIKMQSPEVELSFELGNRLQTYERYLNFLTSPTHKGAEEETLEVHG